jgi:hypothetical protein
MIMKKIILSIVLLTATINLQAQFFRGVGIFVGITESSHRYINTAREDDSLFTHTYPAPSHRSAEYFSFSVGILGEFLKYQNFRWQTEIEYCNKGAVESQLLDRWPITRAGASANAFSYIQWNNFAKIFMNEGYRGTPYFMLGARLEYNLQRGITAYPEVMAAVPKITVSPDVAIGYEFITYSKWKPFVELHYNPDLIKTHVGSVAQWNRTIELRVGVIYRPQKAFDDCNAPRYHGSDY